MLSRIAPPWIATLALDASPLAMSALVVACTLAGPAPTGCWAGLS
jgi:hypothetical protein